ncbi:expressed protein [Phakopsora pachyrhizi]|uniref:Expressed protein n=1 Tax=Phakopsora pachyrhizi TaxID=170000 RepID=A0AAV0AVX2_PHAPC|nr:expressed protein [Phakopsora pachyrhizi]
MFEKKLLQSPLVIFSSSTISSPFDHTSLSIDGQLGSDSFIALMDDETDQIRSIRTRVKGTTIRPKNYPAPQDGNDHDLTVRRGELLVKEEEKEEEEEEMIRLIFYASSSRLKGVVIDERPERLLGSNHSSQAISSTVLHLQSPNCLKTFMRIPAYDQSQLALGSVGDVGRADERYLNIDLRYLHLQIKPLDHHFMFEVGVSDRYQSQIILRFSTFQSKAKRYKDGLVHIPIKFPINRAHTQTSWTELLLDLSDLVAQVPRSSTQVVNSSSSNTARVNDDLNHLGGKRSRARRRNFCEYSSTRFIKVHSNIRLRKIFFTSDGVSPSISSCNSNNNHLDGSLGDDDEEEDGSGQTKRAGRSAGIRPELLLYKSCIKKSL